MRVNKQTSRITLAGAALGLLLSDEFAFAQEQGRDEDQPIEMIVVTATKQGAQSLQAVPFAIQSLDGEELRTARVKEVADLVLDIPGADHTEQTGVAIRSFALRGSGASGAAGDSLIGYYIDDVAFSTPGFQLAPPVQMLDIDRVEVLRGPHGTLYGQGAAGGTMIFHSINPDLERTAFEGQLTSAATNDADDLNYGIHGAVSLPLVQDELGLRISGGYSKRAGYADIYSADPVGEPRTKNANVIEYSSIRGVLLWKPNDNFTLRAQVWNFVPRQDYTQSLSSLEPPFISNFGDLDSFERSDTTISSLSAVYDTGPATITSISAYLDSHAHYDVALPPIPFFPGVLQLIDSFKSESFTQELRINSNLSGPLSWLVGAYYQNATMVFDEDVLLPPDTLITSHQPLDTENIAVFAEISHEMFGGKLIPLAGIRYYEDDRSFSSALVQFGVPSFDSAETIAEVITWRANLGYFPSENLTFFFNAGTGFRSGQLQSSFRADSLNADGIPTSIALDPDELFSVEIGMRSIIADGSVQLGLSLYDIEYRDLPTTVVASNGVAGIAPIGDAESKGIDLEFAWNTPITGLNIGFVGNINDSKYRNIDPLAADRLPAIGEGERLIYTAEHNFRITMDLNRPIGANTDLLAHFNVSRNSDRIMANGRVVPSMTIANASIGFRRGVVEVVLFGENMTDERGPTFVRNSNQFAGPFPLTVGIEFRAKSR